MLILGRVLACVALWLIFESAISWFATCQPIYQGATDHGGNENNCTLFSGPVISIVYFGGVQLFRFLHAYEHELVAGFTIVLAFSTIGLWLATDRLYKAGERQLNLIRKNAAEQARTNAASIKVAQDAAKEAKRSADMAERGIIEADRAWIKVEMDIFGPLIFGEETIEIVAEARFKNVGRTPATSCGFEFRLCTDVGEASHCASESAAHMGRAFVSHLGYGQVIYPDKNATIRETLTIERADFIARIKEIDAAPKIEGEKDDDERFTRSNPALMAFVWYALPRAGRLGKYRYSTGLFEICWKGDASRGFDGSVMTIPLDEIELVATYYSGEFA